MDSTSPTDSTAGIVYVVDDDSSVRHLLRALFESVPLPVQAFDSAEAFLAAYNPGQPGCLIVDFRMPGMSGLTLTERLSKDAISLPIIMITGHGTVQTAVRAMRAGAVDVLEKPFRDDELLNRVHEALRRDREQRRHHEQSSKVHERIATLTAREREVLDLVVDGWLNKQIAEELGISEKTVEVHRAHVMKKLEADGVADLVKMAMLARQSGPKPR